MMRQSRVIYFLFFVFLFFGCTDVKKSPHVMEGVLDLSAINFEKDSTAYIDGQWEFYWEQLLKPTDFMTADLPVKTGYFSIPGYWNGFKVNSSQITGDGYATFRVRIKLMPGEKRLAIRIEEQSTAYQLWANGLLIMGNGRVADTPETAKPYKKICTAEFSTASQYLDLVLQVSNFHAYNGGPYRRITLGSPAAIEKKQNSLFSIDLLLFGMLGVIGVYHLVFYFLRRKDPALMYFSLFCLCWCIGIPFGASGGRFVTLIFPNTPWYWMLRMELLTWFPVVPLFLMFFAALYPLEFSLRATRFAQVMAVSFFTFVLLAPSRLVNITEIPYSLFSIAIAAWMIYRLYLAVRHRRNEAILMFSGFLFFVGTMMNDILFINQIIYSVYLVSVGIAVMTLFQAFALARRYARSFAAVESLTDKLEEKNISLKQMDQLKDEFLANTSHELRTPLNGIIGIAESLVSGVSGRLPDKTLENLSMIVASGKRLTGLVNDILDFSRLRNRDIQLHRQPVDLRSLAETVITVIRPLASAKPLALYNRIPDDLKPAWGDENRLQQIFYNLIGNAVKFTDQGHISVSASQINDQIEVCVTDTGMGLPEDRVYGIFEAFEQIDAADRKGRGGSGLGLSITRQLVALHGGEITVESAAGKGSIFRFTLPVSPVDAKETASPDSFKKICSYVQPVDLIDVDATITELPGMDGPLTILAIDDDAINLQVVTNYLTYKNVVVIPVTGGMQAINMIEKGARPDLVLLDIMMPHMTGYEVCRRLRQQYSASEMPIIMLTAKSGSADMVQGFFEGANDYLIKPFSRDELLARVISQLKLKHAYLTLRENMSLRKELLQRKQSEQELRVMQQQLSFMLNSIDDALLAVNESQEITFCNRVFEKLTGYPAEDLLGKPFLNFMRGPSNQNFSTAEKKALQDCFDGKSGSGPRTVTLIKSDGNLCSAKIFHSLLDIEESPICLMVVQKHAGQSDIHGPESVARSLAVIQAINTNRERLQSIKTSLTDLMPLINEKQPRFQNELKAIDAALDYVSKSLLHEEKFESRRHLAVEVMNCAMGYWTESTGLTKIEFAHQSGLWKVYTNQDGWERTQTLDKYMNIETFPKKPTWIKVFKSVEFIIATCNTPSSLRNRLEILLAKLRTDKIYSI